MKSELSHPFPPLYDTNSSVLILGSFPSVKSRENQFFYGHPKNRFWKVISSTTNKPIPKTIEEKKTLLLESKIALWDVIASCEIEGSADSSIDRVTVNDISLILNTANISAIFCNGKKAHELYRKYIEPVTKREAVCLPSTSPANASWSVEKLSAAYSEAILPFIEL